jgi:trigger factor
VLENLVGRAAAQVLRERKLQTIDTPRIEKVEFELEKTLSFQMKVEKDPDIKAKDYKGIRVIRHAPKVTEEAVQKALQELRERNASLASAAAEKVQKTHFVVIDFEGKIDGEAFAGGSAKNYLLDMNTPQTIAGFSEGILEAKPNEERAVHVTFPADYAMKEFAGKNAVFQVTVKEIKEKKLPTLDDEFAKDLGYATLNELQQKVRESLEKEETAKGDKEVEDQIFQFLLENHRFSVPPTLVEERTRTLIQRARTSLERQGLLQPNDAQAEIALREKVRPQAEKDVRLSYLLKAIAAQEALEARAEDIDKLKKKSLEENKSKSDEVEAYFRNHDVSIRATLTEGKVLEFLKNNAKVKLLSE